MMPLQVQPSSVAETAGLQAGDGILQINGAATETLEHDKAKGEIIRAGNDIVFLVQRYAVCLPAASICSLLRLEY